MQIVKLAAVCVACCIINGTMCVDISNAQDIQLSAEGEARRAAHNFLFGKFSNGKETRFKGKAPNRILDEIVISSEKHTLTGAAELKLPKGSERVASSFRYIVLRGSGLENLGGIEMTPYSSNSHLPVSTRQAEIYRVKVPSMPIPSETMSQATLRIKCKPGTSAIVTEIAFNSQSKLSEQFDDIPYRNLGAEFPREAVEIKIDCQRELSLGGHIDLHREKFCRYYGAPGNLNAGFEKWAAERNFTPGRQIMKFQPALVVGYSAKQPKLKESKSRKGAAELSFFDRYSDRPSKTIDEFRDVKYAMCFNDYPDFMSIKQVGRGTPLIENFDDAADLAGAFVANQIKNRGRSANYWEVKNESTIKAEWDYHWQKEHDSWALMADLHNKVADAIHKSAPETMVGGPSSAWMQVQVKDFQLYRNQVKFMDLTKGHLDFYSHHFYEDFGSLGAWERRKGKYSNYLLGRMEAILDMFQAHMSETDNVRPILITECGSLQPGRGPSDYWLRIRSWSGYMHKLMKRPEQIELAVPFVFLSIPWNPQSGNTVFIPNKGQPNNASIEHCSSTPVRYFFELWRDFDGRRLPVSFDRTFLDVTAVHKNDEIQLAITNMGGRRLSLNIGSLIGELPNATVSQKRLYYVDGEIKYEDNIPHNDGKSIPVDVEETTIVTIKLESPLNIQQPATQRQRWFATGTAVKSKDAADANFEIKISDDPTKIEKAVLHVGVQREGGLGGPLNCAFNGTPLVFRADWANEINHLFATIKVEIDPARLAMENKVTIRGRDGLTITSVHLATEHQ